MNNIINPLNNQSFTARLDISKVRGSKERWTNIAKMFAENTKDYGDELILSGSFKSGLEVTCKPSENLVVKYFLGKDASNVLKNKVDDKKIVDLLTDFFTLEVFKKGTITKK